MPLVESGEKRQTIRKERKYPIKVGDWLYLYAKPGVSFFFKHWGCMHPKQTGRELDGRTWDEVPE